MGKLFSVMVSAFVVAGLLSTVTSAEDDAKKPKKSIKDVMKEAHKSGLAKKVASEKATPEEREELLDLYVALAANKPPKGEEKSWKILSARLVTGAADVVEDPSDTRDLKRAMNCGKCHKLHKPE